MKMLDQHNGYLVIRERNPIELAKFPAGAPLHQSVLLHPRYATGDYEIISVTGYRRGRTIDVFLDQPYEHNGVQYGILNFKGVGADTDREMVVHPTLWFTRVFGHWGSESRERGDDYDRVWGAVRKGEGELEFAPVFQLYGIPEVPQVGLNGVPREVSRNISKVEGRKKTHGLVQIVRACNTNLRIDDAIHWDLQEEADVKRAASIDAAVVKAQIGLIAGGKMFYSTGCIPANRLMDGTFIDAGNFDVWDFKFEESTDFAYSVLTSWEEYFDDEMRRSYLSALEEETGLAFTRVQNDWLSIWHVLDTAMKREVRRRA